MTYRAPLEDILLALNHGAGLDEAIRQGHYGDYDAATSGAVLEEAGRFAEGMIAPLNRDGDKCGARFADGKVTTAPGFADAYRRWREAGWNAVSSPEAYGGQGLPLALNSACAELWNSASVAFALCPMLTAGAAHALAAHGSEQLKKTY